MEMIKLDIVEVKVLTGEADIEKAAPIFENWGCRETVITQSDGVLARADRVTYYEKFSNKSIESTFGVGKRRFGLGRIMAKLQCTSETVIALQFLVMNLEHKLRVLFSQFLKGTKYQIYIIFLFVNIENTYC